MLHPAHQMNGRLMTSSLS